MIENKCKHLISLTDLSNAQLEEIIGRGLAIANGEVMPNDSLNGLVLGIYFRKTSTRTRTSFSAAALRLGAKIIMYGPNDLQENTGESMEDTIRVLSSMLDGLVARTAGSSREMEIFASQNRMPVVNAMSQDEHPTQAIADLTTMIQHFGKLSNLRVLYIGEGNNTAVALALSLPRFTNTKLYFCTPPGYGLPAKVVKISKQYAQQYGSLVTELHDMNNLPDQVDVIYTTRWETTGTAKSDPNWKAIFRPYAVSAKIMDKYPGSILMHDLPANRNEEVDAAVLDGERSIVFKQAENKLHSAVAVLEWCLK